jgi:hypothetical protein
MEEIEAKDKIIAECRHAINQRDMSLQRHVKANGGGTQHAKEDQYNKTVLSNFDKAQALQEEKIILSEKSRSLVRPLLLVYVHYTKPNQSSTVRSSVWISKYEASRLPVFLLPIRCYHPS